MKLCCIFNYPPLYRKSIYKLIDQEFDTLFLFGDKQMDIARLDDSMFKKPVKYLHVVSLRSLEMYRGIWKLPFAQYDTFLVTGSHIISYVPLIIFSHLLGKKVYGWGHGIKNFKGKFPLLSKWFIRNWDGFYVYGEGGRKRLVELGMPKEKIHVIYNSLNEGVECNVNYTSSIIKDYFKNDKPTLIFVGRLTKVKKLEWLIDAMARHNSKHVFYNLLLVGDGVEREHLEKVVKQKQLSANVWFYGQCYDDDKLKELIYNSDLCVSPGNVGLTALNSMQYGTPVLSHNDFETQMPEYETIVPGKTGDLYEKNNFDDFCDKIERWLSTDCNRNEIRQNCYSMINGKWNSRYQIDLLKRTLGK